jgi:hypothetical protein
MQIYSCGGAGINLGKHFEPYRGQSEKGFSNLNVRYIDSSDSNLGSVKTDPENIHVLEETAGAGKKRSLPYEEIRARASEILLKYKPEDINIVLHGFGGGSGSVIGPVLVSELLSRGHAVIVIGVGSTDSRIEIDNTVDTIRSYATISKIRKRPVPVIYYENNKDTPRGSVDTEVYAAVAFLSAFFSGDNHEMDKTDLYNFLNYQEVTEYDPRLSYLEFFTQDIQIGKDHSLISVATLSDLDTPTTLNHLVEYQCTGFIDPTVTAKLGIKLPIHLCVMDGVFNDILSRLTKLTTAVKEHRNARINKTIDVDMRDATEDGIVL